MADVLLGVDTGTGSTKGVLTTIDGTILRTAVRQHSMSLPRPGWAEVDAEAVWWADFAAVCRELVTDLDEHHLVGMCVSGVGPCLLLCDADLAPVRPAILYGIDMRATAEIDELTERLGAQKVLERCGKALSTQAVGPKMTWVERHEPEAWRRARRWFNSNSYLVAKLTGEQLLDHFTLSQNDSLYSLQRKDCAHA